MAAEGITQVIVYLTGVSIVGLVGWVWYLHDKAHKNEIRVLELRNTMLQEFVSKETERKLFAKMDEFGKALANLITEVRVMGQRINDRERN